MTLLGYSQYHYHYHAGVHSEWMSALVPDKLDDGDDDGQKKTDAKDDEDAANVGHRQRVDVYPAFLFDVAQPATVHLAPPAVEQRLQRLVFLQLENCVREQVEVW